MTTLVLPLKRNNCTAQAFALALCLYIPLTSIMVWATNHLALNLKSQNDSQTLKMLITHLQEPTPVHVVEPISELQQVMPSTPTLVEAESEPKTKPVVKHEKPKPKPEKVNKTQEPPKRPVNKTQPQEVPASAKQVVSTNLVPSNPQPSQNINESTKSAPVQTLVYGRSKDEFLVKIVSALKKNLFYPRQARAMGVEGVVLVSFEILENGSVTNIKVVKSTTDSEILKDAAITTVKNASSDFSKHEKKVKIVVPVEFKLR